MSGCSGRGEEMRGQLLSLEAANRADSVMRNDSLAEAVAAYFDRHGTPNERMRAYYMLGRTYFDLGELPRALEIYNQAADCADTTASDCRYDVLSRIHAQKAQVFRALVQPRSQIRELDIARHYAITANDTMMAIDTYARKAGAYEYLKQADSVIVVNDSAMMMSKEIGNVTRAAQIASLSITSLLQQGQLAKARQYMETYEHASGFFDEKMDICKGREIYYYIKGSYYMAVDMVDSAETYFRKELKTGKDLNNQIAGTKGLMDVYKYRKISDSIAKYAELGYALNDSAYSLSEMENIQRVQANYNYNHAKLLAEQKAHEATRLFYMIIFLVASFIITILIGSVFVLNYRKKTILQIQQYKNDLSNLEKAQTELIVLRSEHEMSSILIKNKNEEIAALQHKVENYQNKIKLQSHDTLETRLQNSPIVKHLRQLLRQNPPKPAGRDDMRQLKILINEQIPSFYSVLNSESNTLSMIEYEICILIRVGFAPTDLCKLTGISDGYASNIRRRLLKKVYGLEGSPKEFDCKIKEIPADIS